MRLKYRKIQTLWLFFVHFKSSFTVGFTNVVEFARLLRVKVNAVISSMTFPLSKLLTYFSPFLLLDSFQFLFWSWCRFNDFSLAKVVYILDLRSLVVQTPPFPLHLRLLWALLIATTLRIFHPPLLSFWPWLPIRIHSQYYIRQQQSCSTISSCVLLSKP